MKVHSLFLIFTVLAGTAHAQLSTGGLGGSGLAPRIPKPGAPGASSSAVMPPPTNGTAANGILLDAGWDKRVTGPARAKNRDMADLRACLEKYGQPEADLGAHPDAEVFPGIPYLSPLKTVEGALMRKFGGSFGLASEFTIATEGFPLGLKFRKYDRSSLGIGANTHFYLLIDKANRVISTAFTGVNAPPFVPQPFPAFSLPPIGINRDDLIDKSDSGARAQMADSRDHGKFIVVYLAGKRNVTWYVPEPLINLILYCSQLQ